jgi:signal transduction histidine kinase
MVASEFDLLLQDDRMLDDAVAGQAVAEVNASFSRNRIERMATLNERLRLARELHDGVLQSLTGAVLQLEATSRLVDSDPKAARARLREIQQLIVEEQCQLRKWIDDVRRVKSTSMASYADLAAALDTLSRRVTRWGPRVQFIGPTTGSIERTLGDHVYRLAEEALSNVTKHASAQVARLEVRILRDRVHVVVEDDGCGFTFRGRYDLAALDVMQQGPVSLKERIASLDGALVLTSTLSGSRLEISLPLQQRPIRCAQWTARRA